MFSIFLTVLKLFRKECFCCFRVRHRHQHGRKSIAEIVVRRSIWPRLRNGSSDDDTEATYDADISKKNDIPMLHLASCAL